jgi:pyrroline-5-carboxylate reductase
MTSPTDEGAPIKPSVRNKPIMRKSRIETVGFIGAGNMAEAIARGMIDSELFPVLSIKASDPAAVRRNHFRSMGIEALDDNAAVIDVSDIVIIAVKPQSLPQLFDLIGDAFTPNQLVISICAGTPIGYFEKTISESVRLMRAMPNTPLQVGMGITAITPGTCATESDLELTEAIFGAGGKVVRVDEHLMDAVTAVSGSGPAYFYLFVEALIEAGKKHGLNPIAARELALHTGRGAMEMLIQTGLPPAELRNRVTSKGGTTEAGLRAMHASDVPEGIIAAVDAAVQRGKELSQGN